MAIIHKRIFTRFPAFTFLVLFVIFNSCTSVPRFSSTVGSGIATNKSSSSGESNFQIGDIFRGKASYYADKFHGNATASGEVFDMNEFTAAHKSLPFGTIIKVTNLKNGRSVTVKINDRGPFVAGRILDLSYAAAQELDMLRDGVADVEVEIISLP